MTWSGLDSLPWFWKPFEHAWFAIPIAVIGPGILAFLLGFMVFRSRVKGVYFSIITQALALSSAPSSSASSPIPAAPTASPTTRRSSASYLIAAGDAAPALLGHGHRAAWSRT